MYTPSSNSLSRQSHSRVQEMLKRARHIPSSLSSGESLMQGAPTYSQAFASTMSDTKSGGGLGKGLDMSSMNNPHTQKLLAFVCAATALTTLFILFGRNVDAFIQNYEERENVDRNHSTHLLLLTGQLCFNVAMLVVPYVAMHKYFSDSYICQYYLVIAAFWVLSLHAQPFLKRRFYDAFVSYSSEQRPHKKENTSSNREADQKLIAQYLKEVETTPPLTTTQHIETNNMQYRSLPATTQQHNNSPYTQHDNKDRMQALSTQAHFISPDHEPFQNGDSGTNIADLF